MGKKVTIREVAAECGLSVSAVSQVLNGKEIGIPQKTKEKVRAAAEKLRYCPNSAARSLVTSRSDTVGVLVPDISNAFFGEAFKEIQRRMGEEGFDVLLCSGDGTAKQDERFLRLFAARGADGLIVAPAAETLEEKNAEKFAALLEEIRIPYVYLDRYPALPCVRVSADHRAGGYAAARCLLKNGHTKIGCIAGPAALVGARLRLEGFCDALAEAGIRPLAINAPFTAEGGERAAKALFGRGLTALFASDDLQAYGAMRAAAETGVRIPDDVSLVGYDDLQFSALANPPLTTISQPVKDMAAAAAELLLRRMRGEDAENPPLFVPRLIERQTVKNLKEEIE
ncbi:LacI family transcriptional regulator [Candidatus Borkfalkia ceftriaxoniphila]|uniref:LacI family transcriptional regulator n=1 Tax=Candidatus Borkfalkia ceftriaxoniphila TaxID=2508949 RepID=A0A4Q2KCT6_9FIRM|nr:LacI family DNA-binding transcriptional regulator [Candidatus Borkfalkia ceftriaxoniphila]RXZ61213.1 LacI family transcriptional regulator [Candidatus Borkfalkia ceftriaxoniphila]